MISFARRASSRSARRERRALFSGDTVVDREHWNESILFGLYRLALLAEQPENAELGGSC
jgi:hypothetical protein